MTPTQEWLAVHINNLVESRFYGKVTLQFEAGNITTVKKEETLKPPKSAEEVMAGPRHHRGR